METYVVKKEKDFEKIKDENGYSYKGNLRIECNLKFIGRLYVEGYLSIEAGSFIKAGDSIEAGGFIEAGSFIKAGYYIKARTSIKAGSCIEAGSFIKAGSFIEAGSFIKAGTSYGIYAGLSITCKGKLIYGLKCFAGICTWRTITDDEKTITCGEHNGGVIEYGILKEIGLEEKSKTIISRESALSMLKTKYNEDFEIV